jgi:cyclic beta-1,2-glucan synthetase
MPGISPWLWTRFVLAMIAFPALIPFLAGINAHLEGISKRNHFRGLASDFSLGLSQAGLTAAFLAYQACQMADAIGRTLIRLLITHKHLLEWVTAAQAKHGVDLNLFGIYRRMASGVVLAIAAFAAVRFDGHHALFAATPFVVLWMLSPAIAYWISLPPQHSDLEELSALQTQALRAISRRTWRFFETFVTAEEHFLPPDNFQEDPKPVVAHRTSPTNLGLYLLSILAARDFAWVGTVETVERIEATLDTIGKLEQFRGHLYNWYDTRDLHPLDPKYVSTVDSGNIAGHLLALARGCRELIQKWAVDSNTFTGIDDAVGLLREALVKVTDAPRVHAVTRKQLSDAVDLLAASLHPVRSDAAGLGLRIVEVSERAHTVADIAQTLAQELGDAASSDLRVWSEAAKACADSHLRDAAILLPWLGLSLKEAPTIAGSRASSAPEWIAIEQFFPRDATLADAPGRFEGAIRELTALRAGLTGDPASPPERAGRIDTLVQLMRQSAADASALHRRLLAIAERSEELFERMDFGFLFDGTRKLFSIGYRASDGHLDPNCYDLLASEARLASFIAIAKGDVPSSHWFRLGRALTPVGRGSALISWSGSMFEYLMPALVMRSPANSLLSQTYQQVIIRQVEYGKERGVPWGISESAYAARDLDFTYQYSSFGVPGLGLKRGLSEDLVIAPYATALAAMVDPSTALQNLDSITQQGGRGV